MKPARSILDPEFVYVSADKTNVAATFERVRREISEGASSATPERSGVESTAAPTITHLADGSSVKEGVIYPPGHCHCDAPSWWSCKTRGCRKAALARYGETVARFEPRADHDLDVAGRPLKAGK